MGEQIQKYQWGQLLPQGGIVNQTFPLNSDSHIIGRKGDLNIQNQKISGNHCKIRYDNKTNKAYITDLSCNGTYLFDKKLVKSEETILQNGDLIYLLKDKKEWIGFIYNANEKGSKIDEEQKNSEKQEQIQKDNQDEIRNTEESENLKKMHDLLQQQLTKIKQEVIKYKNKFILNKPYILEKASYSINLFFEKSVQELFSIFIFLILQDETFEKDSTCVICMELLYNPYLITPCLHNYCFDCMSELTKKKDIVCPQCRVKPQSIQKNYPLKNMIDTFVKKYPEKKWSEEAQKKKEENSEQNLEILNKFNEKLQRGTKSTRRKKRESYSPSSSSESEYSEDYDEEYDDEDEEEEVQAEQSVFNNQVRQFGIYQQFNFAPPPIPSHLRRCQECENEREDDQFKCSNYQIHIRCQNCDKMMPSRNDNTIYPQNCTICEKSYCNLYFKEDCQSKYGSSINYHLKPFRDLPIPQTINASVFANRNEEVEILEQFLPDPELRTMIIYEHMSENFIKKGKFKYEISQKYMRTQQQKSFDIEMDTPICSTCWPQVWSQMILKYRVDIQNQLPQQVKSKPNCWYGVNCSTKNIAHNGRFNHACPQTKS